MTAAINRNNLSVKPATNKPDAAQVSNASDPKYVAPAGLSADEINSATHKGYAAEMDIENGTDKMVAGQPNTSFNEAMYDSEKGFLANNSKENGKPTKDVEDFAKQESAILAKKGIHMTSDQIVAAGASGQMQEQMTAMAATVMQPNLGGLAGIISAGQAQNAGSNAPTVQQLQAELTYDVSNSPNRNVGS